MEELIGISTDFESWIVDKERKFVNCMTDVDGLCWLNKQHKFDGFMIGPVGIFHTIPVETKTRIIDNPKDFVDYCKNTKNCILLYDLIFLPNMPRYFDLKDDFTHQKLDTPVIDTKFGVWKIRYAEVE